MIPNLKQLLFVLNVALVIVTFRLELHHFYGFPFVNAFAVYAAGRRPSGFSSTAYQDWISATATLSIVAMAFFVVALHVPLTAREIGLVWLLQAAIVISSFRIWIWPRRELEEEEQSESKRR